MCVGSGHPGVPIPDLSPGFHFVNVQEGQIEEVQSLLWSFEVVGGSFPAVAIVTDNFVKSNDGICCRLCLS